MTSILDENTNLVAKGKLFFLFGKIGEVNIVPRFPGGIPPDSLFKTMEAQSS